MTQEELNAQLLETVRDGDTVKAEELLNAGAEVNSVNYRGGYPVNAGMYIRQDGYGTVSPAKRGRPECNKYLG